MTTDQLAAVIHLRDLAYSIQRRELVVPDWVLEQTDDLIAQERMRQRLATNTVRRLYGVDDSANASLHSVRADSEAYALDDPKHPTYHDRMSDLA